MWRKLNSNQDIDSISEGKIIIKYPIHGEPEQEIDLSSEDIFMLYEVSQVTGADVRLQVPPDDQRQAPAVPAITAANEPVWFSKLELLQQNVWWIN